MKCHQVCVHLIFFSLYVRGFQVQVSWQCNCCGVGQKMRDGLQPPSPPLGGGETYRLFVLFSWWVKLWQGRDGRMLSITLPGNFTHSQGKIQVFVERVWYRVEQ